MASLALEEPSLTVTVMVAVPNWLVAGVIVTVRLEPLPPKTMLPLGTTVGLEDEPLTARLPGGVSLSPTVNGIGPVDVSSAVVWSAMSEMVGGVLLAGLTVSRKVSLAF